MVRPASSARPRASWRLAGLESCWRET